MVIVVAISTISSFLIFNNEQATALLRFPLSLQLTSEVTALFSSDDDHDRTASMDSFMKLICDRWRHRK